MDTSGNQVADRMGNIYPSPPNYFANILESFSPIFTNQIFPVNGPSGGLMNEPGLMVPINVPIINNPMIQNFFPSAGHINYPPSPHQSPFIGRIAHPTALGNNRLTSVMEESLQEKAIYKHVISEEGLKKITFQPYMVEQHSTSTCAITREDFEVGEEVAILPCGHIFNKEAILTWTQKKSAECPVCRYKLDSIEVKDETESTYDSNDMLIIPRFTNIRQMLMDLIDERIQDEEDQNIQHAIIASLRDNN